MFLKKSFLYAFILLLSGTSNAVEIVSIGSTLTNNEEVAFKTFRMPQSQAEVKALDSRVLPGSKILLYNVYTYMGELNWNNLDASYVRGLNVNHLIIFCNISKKTTNGSIVYDIDGPSPYKAQFKFKLLPPNECGVLNLKKPYDYTGLYLFKGTAVATGEGQNTINTDYSKFKIY